MGKGDKKTKKGKIAAGSYGVLRPRSASSRKANSPAGGKLKEEPKTRKAGAARKK